MSNKGGHIRKGSKSQEKTTDVVYEKPLTHTSDFFFRDLIGKITPFLSDPGHGLCSLERVTMIIFYDLLKQYIFFLLTCLCVRTHCKPIPCNGNRISLWSHSNSKILSLSEGILLSLQGKPVMKTGYIWRNWTTICAVLHQLMLCIPLCVACTLNVNTHPQ